MKKKRRRKSKRRIKEPKKLALRKKEMRQKMKKIEFQRIIINQKNLQQLTLRKWMINNSIKIE